MGTYVTLFSTTKCYLSLSRVWAKSLGQEPQVSVNAKDGQTGKRCIMRALNPHFQPASNLSPDPESPSGKNRQESASNMQLTDTCLGLTPYLVTTAHLVAPKMGH